MPLSMLYFLKLSFNSQILRNSWNDRNETRKICLLLFGSKSLGFEQNIKCTYYLFTEVQVPFILDSCHFNNKYLSLLGSVFSSLLLPLLFYLQYTFSCVP